MVQAPHFFEQNKGKRYDGSPHFSSREKGPIKEGTLNFKTVSTPLKVPECDACCSLVTMPRTRLRTVILSCLFFVGSFVYYGLSLNQSSVGGDQNQFLTFTLYGLMEIPALLFAMISLSYFGRRSPTMLLYLCAGMYSSKKKQCKSAVTCNST